MQRPGQGSAGGAENRHAVKGMKAARQTNGTDQGSALRYLLLDRTARLRVHGDYVSLEAEVYLDGPWGTSGGGNRQLYLQWTGYTASDLFIPTDQETTVSTGTGANFPTGSFSSGENVFEIAWSVFITQ